jgi:hypothetical protein
VRDALSEATCKWDASCVPLPISFNPWESDVASIRDLLDGIGISSDGGASLDTPLKVIHEVSRCRLVVTGSYHAAVFALSQGIPAIGLAASDVYRDKFAGLADQFGTGCEVLFMDTRGFAGNLLAAMHRLWTSAEAMRPSLFVAAERQIEAAVAAYRTLKQIAT